MELIVCSATVRLRSRGIRFLFSVEESSLCTWTLYFSLFFVISIFIWALGRSMPMTV